MSNCKYYKQKKQVSYNSGQTWSDVSPVVYQVGNLYEMDSMDCSHGSSQIRWVVVPGDFLCEGKNKYEKEIEQYSTDGGNTWRNVYPTTFRKGRLIETNSAICDYKWEGHYFDNGDSGGDNPCGAGYRWVDGVGCVYVDPIKIVRCTSSSETLTNTDTTYRPYALFSGTIGDCVTSIDDWAFSHEYIDGTPYNTELTSVTIPNSVVSIGKGAFWGCNSLTSIVIPDSVTTIGVSAFTHCTSLTSCTIGSGVTSISDNTFWECRSLTGITIPDNITSIGEWAFYGCSDITDIIIPDSVTTIGGSVFRDCISLTSCTIGSGVTSIDYWAFMNCSGLTGITINATTPPTIHQQTFIYTNCPIYVPCDSVGIYCQTGGWSNYASRIRGIPPCVETYKFQITYSDLSTIKKPCTPNGIISNDDVNILDKSRSAVTDVTIYECVTEIGDRAFSNCSGLSGITIPNTVTTIGAYAFSACTSLSSVTIPSGVTEINSFTFNKCSGLTSVEIPNSVTSIKQDAFSYCTSLPSITIPSGVTSIGDYAFYRCSGLTSIICEPTVPPSFNWDSFSYTNDCPIYVPCESVNSYKSDSSWKWLSSRIFGISPCGTYRWVDLDPRTDYYCSGTTKYYKQQKQVSYDSGQTWNNVVPAEYQQGGVAQEKSADCGYSGLKLRATYSGGSTYNVECDSATTLTTGDTKPSGYDYTAMTSAEIGDCVTTIYSDAFSGCTSLSSVTIQNSVTSIGDHAFQSCTSLSNITIPDNVTSIGWYAFAGCTGLTSINIPSGVTSIDTYAFAGCRSLTSIVIPDNVTIIDNYAFQNCSGLTSITIPDSVTSINYSVFYNCTSLTSVTIGSGITSIGGYAFQNCSGLQSMTVNAVTPPTLGYNAFRNTNNFAIYVPAGSVDTYKSTSGWSSYSSRIRAIP